MFSRIQYGEIGLFADAMRAEAMSLAQQIFEMWVEGYGPEMARAMSRYADIILDKERRDRAYLNALYAPPIILGRILRT